MKRWYCISHREYSVHDVNGLLKEYGLQTLFFGGEV